MLTTAKICNCQWSSPTR